ncbi:pyruvate decarboxylase isozyme 1 [Cryptosporidium andersoni]|uniref:Pyruvate decarboxylase isozyme 1 n=1 Tax=Cryptosporidium andersoni TaxID=117008 RepID=A0A1J4MWI2_9CRYT|nr:pyruvate decarboxylase isozyme 1 [Cryptosporidium andersoni]
MTRAHTHEVKECEKAEKISISAYLCMRLKELGCDHIFGVPGDFSLSFLNVILKSEVKYINTCNELNAAYAADSYARIRGIGALSTTFVVGELSAINGIAGSFSEDVPVVHIGSAPATAHHKKKTLLHHSLYDYSISKRMYDMITIDSVKIDNKESAARDIDRVLINCIKHSKPVYIQLCADYTNELIDKPTSPLKIEHRKSNESNLDTVMKQILSLLKKSQQPVFMPGYELLRFRKTELMKELLEVSKIPFATMIMGKTVISEHHPLYIGLYFGKKGDPHVTQYIEESDCLMIIGEKLMDFNTGFFSATLPENHTLHCNFGKATIGDCSVDEVFVEDIIERLIQAYKSGELKPYNFQSATPPYPQAMHRFTHRPQKRLALERHHTLSLDRMFDTVVSSLPEGVNVLAETGTSLFSASEVMIPNNSQFFGQSFFGSIGYTVGGLVGLCFASPKRTFAFIGDGSLQVTVQDISTILKNKHNPVIVIINNDGYTIERVICDHPYNDIAMWRYSKLAKLFGFKDIPSFITRTEGEFEHAFTYALKHPETTCIIEVVVEKMDCNHTLKCLGKEMAINSNVLEEEQQPSPKRLKSEA